ncbi:MAG: NlpA lipoprotein [Bacillota bacterium]|jgi:NitT/TauT family transport system substrate-binding protein|nr:NlpA lipoprotein [Bacillota bacterium]
MKRINKLILLTIVLVTLVAFTGCAKKSEEIKNTDNTKKTIKIAYLPITHAVPLYVESEDSIINSETLKNVNVELVKFGSWPELMDALNTGKVDGASVLIEFAMKSKEQGIDLKTVALGHRDGNNVTVANDINSAADLKGKTVAIPQRFSTQNILLYQMLENAGLEYTDVNVVELPPAEMPAALSEGRIAGYVVAEPFGAKAVSSGKAKTLFTSQDLWKDSICCGLVLRGDFIKNNPEAVQELVNGYVKAGNAAEAKNENITNITSKFMAVDKNIMDLSLKSTTYTNLKINEKDYEQLTIYLKTMGLLDNSPKFNDFVDNSFIDKAE